MSAPQGAVAQLGRLLELIPWLLARPGVDVAAAATEFDVSPEQIRKDLELAFVCGLPGHLPDDLIDVSLEGDKIVVSNAEAIARPLRLAPDEAIALLVGLRALADVPGPHARDALDRAMAKLERAAGDAADAGRRVSVQIEGDVGHAEVLRDALAQARRIHLRYYVPARDEVTERDVDPLRLVVVEGRTYLEGWCRLAEDVRLFRLDRIEGVQLLAEPATPPATASLRDLGVGAFSPTDAKLQVIVDLGPRALWAADAYPCDDLGDSASGGRLIRLYAGDVDWVVRLMLRLGDTAQVVEPAAVAEEVQSVARRALAGYRNLG